MSEIEATAIDTTDTDTAAEDTAADEGQDISGVEKAEGAGAAAGKDGKTGDAVKDGIAAVEKKWKLKNKDAEVEVDEKELVRRAQLGMEAERAIHEGRKSKRDAEILIRMIKEDPVAILSHPMIGHDVKALAEKVLLEQIKLEAMSPEQREAFEAKQKLKAYEDEKKQREAAETAKKKAELETHWAGEYQKQIIGALNESGLPRTPYTVKRIAGYMHDALTRGIQITAKDVIPLVREDYMNEQKALFGAANEDTIAALMSDEVAEKFRKALLKKVRPQDSVEGEIVNGEVSRDEQPDQPAGPKKKLSKEDFWAEIDKRVEA